MSLGDIFSSLLLIVRAPRDACSPLGLIFPLNPSLGICPPEQNVYLRFPPASQTGGSPGCWAERQETVLCSRIPAARAAAAGQQPWLQTPTLDPLQAPRWTSKGRGPGFAHEGKVAPADPWTSLSLKPCRCAASRAGDDFIWCC